MDVNSIVILIIVCWTIGLSIAVYRISRHYARLVGNTSQYTLKDILEKLLEDRKELRDETGQLTRKVTEISDAIGYHLTRVGIVRFNPFSDTGGSQSFTVALLDERNNGIVMTSLFARTGNRWYVKEVLSGQGRELELTKEERQAIEKAKKARRDK